MIEAATSRFIIHWDLLVYKLHLSIILAYHFKQTLQSINPKIIHTIHKLESLIKLYSYTMYRKKNEEEGLLCQPDDIGNCPKCSRIRKQDFVKTSAGKKDFKENAHSKPPQPLSCNPNLFLFT